MKKLSCKFLTLYLAISLSQIIFSQQGWYQLTSGTTNNLRSVYFTDINTGYIAGFNGTVLKTTNGGLNWTSQQSGTTEELSSVHFIGQTGFVVGGANTLVILKTTNGGLNWASLSVSGVSALHGVFMTDPMTAFAAGHNGKIIKTTNGGINWSVYDTYPVNHFNSIFFVNPNTGYTGGTFHTHAGGELWRTNNGGASWVRAGGVSYSVFFVNSETGYNAGYEIAKTTNSGTNWTYQSLGGSVSSVWFTSLTTGYIAGSLSNNGRIFKTSNSGLNWITQVVPAVGPLNSISFIDLNTGYSVGNSGTILKTTNGGVTGLIPVGNEIPGEYKLYQNYPNPFNPNSKIKFQISKLSDVKLIVFDILGKEMAILVNVSLKPGTYEVEFSGEDYPSGIYFYRLQTAGFNQTLKMSLIK